jgi:SNF2 family DNA or RNA helicase
VSPTGIHATIAVDGDDVTVTGGDHLRSRPIRLFFRSVLGAELLPEGWRCPRRSRTIAEVVVRVNTFLEAQGWRVQREGVADREVERELARRRSFDRTRLAAADWKRGVTVVDPADLLARLESLGWRAERALLPHQMDGALHALAAANAANFSVPGAGKTVIALAAAAAHLAAGTVELVIVVGPLACFGPWEAEAAAALPDSLRVRRVRGTAANRRLQYLAVEPGELLLLSYASAAADQLALVQLCRARDVLLVVDESHRIKRFRGGVWAPALATIAEHARVRMILSGTPMPNSGRDLYSQLNVLWPGRQLTGPPDTFAARVDNDLDGVLRDIHPFVARTPKEALGLRPYEIHRHEIELQPTQGEIYDLILGNFRRRLEDASAWAGKLNALRRGRPIRLIQAAANPDLFNRADNYYRVPPIDRTNPTLMDRLANYTDHEVPAKTMLALRLIADITEQGSKVVCWSNFLANLDDLAERVRHDLGVACYQVDGRVPTDDEPANDADRHRENPNDADTRERVIARFLAPGRPAVLVTNPASCSESISLHRTCHNAIYLDRTYDCAQFLQSIDRVHRLGLPDNVTVKVHILQATHLGQPTIDHLVDASLTAKDAIMRQLLEGAVLRPIGQCADPADDAEGNLQDLDALLHYLLGEDLGD